MKHLTPESMKFKKLQRRLGVSAVVVAGTLEFLWIATQKNAKRGDIGQFSNEEIAIECGWEGDSDAFIQALIDCGWLDVCDTCRLVVHDWADHAPRYIHAWIKSQKTTFAVASSVQQKFTVVATTEATVVTTTEATVVKTTEGGIPNVTKPNVTKPTLSLSQGSFEPDQTTELKPQPEPEPKPKPKPRASQVRVPPELSVAWSRWCDFRLAIDGRPIGDTQAETILMDLGRRGAEKAIRDIEFSILKSAKSILDSDNDYQKRQTAQSPKKRRVGI